MSKILGNITQYMKSQENVTHFLGKRQPTYANPKMTQMLEISDKDFKATIINTLSENK